MSKQFKLIILINILLSLLYAVSSYLIWEEVNKWSNWNAVSAALVEIGYKGWGICTGFSYAPPLRLLNKAGKVLSRHQIDRWPGIGWMLIQLQAAMTLSEIRDVAERADRFLR